MTRSDENGRVRTETINRVPGMAAPGIVAPDAILAVPICQDGTATVIATFRETPHPGKKGICSYRRVSRAHGVGRPRQEAARVRHDTIRTAALPTA